MNFYKISFIIATCLITHISFGQGKTDISKQTQCASDQVHNTLVVINNELEKQSYSLEMFQTEVGISGVYIPFYITMEQGALYQINLVGSHDYKQIDFVIMGEKKEKFATKKLRSKKNDDHVVSQNFIAPYTGTFTIIGSQNLGQKSKVGCMGISVMKANPSK